MIDLGLGQLKIYNAAEVFKDSDTDDTIEYAADDLVLPKVKTYQEIFIVEFPSGNKYLVSTWDMSSTLENWLFIKE